MEESDVTFENYCMAIEQFAPCMDDYPYVYDLKNDRYFISEKAVGRFYLDSNLFQNVQEEHRKFVYPEDIEMLTADLQKMVNGIKDEHDIEYRWIGSDGKPIWIHCKGRVIKDELGQPLYMIGCVNEIGERQKADNITGLKQTNYVEQLLDHYDGPYPKGFFMRLGLDGFRHIVERFGMEYGDQVLHKVADCIKERLNQDQRLYRAISDEFLVMDFAGGTLEEADQLYRTIREEIDRLIEENRYEAVFTISGGIISTQDLARQNYSEVMRMSRFALSMAKQAGRNQLYTYNHEDYAGFLRRRDITRALRKAVANNYEGFELYFQPIMYADTGELYAAESLCRFLMDGKMVSPVEFIPILEETGLIIPVGRWIIRRAVSMCSECRKKVPDFRVTINISYVQILKSAVVNDIIHALDTYGLSPSGIVVELTESGALDTTPAVRKVWDRLRAHGVRIAIDDFGTGYSNLQYISDLMPNVVKIDRGFTIEALQHIYMNRLLANIIRMAHSMKLHVCIEGIETEQELATIKELNPDYIQGYFYGKPCGRENFLASYI